jgi:hypothetical protein
MRTASARDWCLRVGSASGIFVGNCQPRGNAGIANADARHFRGRTPPPRRAVSARRRGSQDAEPGTTLLTSEEDCDA